MKFFGREVGFIKAVSPHILVKAEDCKGCPLEGKLRFFGKERDRAVCYSTRKVRRKVKCRTERLNKATKIEENKEIYKVEKKKISKGKEDPCPKCGHNRWKIVKKHKLVACRNCGTERIIK